MALAVVGLAADDPHPVISGRDGPGDGEGLVGRPVVHDQDLHRTGLPRQRSQVGSQGLR